MPRGAAPTTHILKPAINGLTDHDLDEHICSATAAHLGLPAATSCLQTFGSERALVVTRDDRTPRDGSIVRIHQEDLCQALGVHPDQKDEADGGPGVDDMASLLRRITHRREEIARLSSAVAFNWLILGVDAHAKNYSLLLSGPQVRLAPLYDLASAAPSSARLGKEELAQEIGGEYWAERILDRHLGRLAKSAGLRPDDFIADVTEMAGRLPSAMAEAVERSELTAEERTVAEQMRSTISRWSDRCHRILIAERG